MRCLGPDKLRLLASPGVAATIVYHRARLLPSFNAAAASSTPSTAAGGGIPGTDGDADGGIRFVYEPPRRFTLGALRKRRQSPPTSAKPRIDLLVEGNPLGTSSTRVGPLAEALRSDAAAALPAVLRRKALSSPSWKMPRVALLSLVLCDDPHIRQLNSRHRGKDAATDVLSFELDDELDFRVHLPIKLMGDLVMSLDTAERQAEERGHSLLDECRILLIHGLLHLAGYDHERGREAHLAMAAEERSLLAELGWRGQGLITAADGEGAGQGGGGGRGTEGETGSGGIAGKEGDGEAGTVATPRPPSRGAGGGITAGGSDAGFLWREVAGAGGTGTAAGGKAAGVAAAGTGARRGQEGGGGGAREHGATQPPPPPRRPPAQPSTSAPPQQQQQQQQQRAGKGGGGGGPAPSRGGRGRGGGAGAARAVADFGATSAGPRVGPASSGKAYGTISGCAAAAGASMPPLLPAPGTIGAGRWLYGGARLGAAAVRCFCSVGGGDGPGDDPAGAGGGGDGGGGGGGAASIASASSTATAIESASGAGSEADGAAASSDGDGAGDGAEGVAAAFGARQRRRRIREIAIVALDLDGTLLDSRSRILPSSVAAIRAAAAAGVTVVAATGKARPAALAAAAAAGLAAPGLLVWSEGPGVFLQGLAVHGRGGRMLSDAALPQPVVEAAYRYSAGSGVSLCAFLGDTCAAPFMTPQLRELHTTYYEPLAEVVPSAASLLAGSPVRKLLFMSDPSTVSEELLPYWTAQLEGSGAQVMQAVPNMLEIVPAGVNKWAGVVRLLGHLGLPASALMAVGDGGNDLEMVAGAGVGVAMGNALPAVRAAAAAVVAGHDDGGVAEAFERFVL